MSANGGLGASVGRDHRLCVWDAAAAAGSGIGGVGRVGRVGRVGGVGGAGDVGAWEAACSVDEAHAKAVNGVALVHARPDGVAAAAAAASGTAAAAAAVAAAEGGPRAVTAGGDGVLHIWQVGRLVGAGGGGGGGGGGWCAVRLHTLRGHGAAVGAVVCCEEQQIVLSAAADCTLRSWDLCSGAPLLRLPLAPAFATAGLPPPSGPTGTPTANDLCLVTRGPQVAGLSVPASGTNPTPNPHPEPIPTTAHHAPHTTHHTPHTTHHTPHTTHHTPHPTPHALHPTPLVAQAAERDFVP